MADRWVPVPGYEGAYQVSDAGQVRSVDRYITNPFPGRKTRTQLIKGRLLKPGIAKAGRYPYVNLSNDTGDRRTFHVHRLVLLAFVGPMPTGMQTRHLNGNATDNRLDNLAYGTPTENGADRKLHGTSGRKAQCLRGHPLSGPNVRKDPNTGRHFCKSCQRIRYHQKKESA